MKEMFTNNAIDKILNLLKPEVPKRLILGKHYIPDGIRMNATVSGEQMEYRGVPIIESDDKYEIDFEI